MLPRVEDIVPPGSGFVAAAFRVLPGALWTDLCSRETGKPLIGWPLEDGRSYPLGDLVVLPFSPFDFGSLSHWLTPWDRNSLAEANVFIVRTIPLDGRGDSAITHPGVLYPIHELVQGMLMTGIQFWDKVYWPRGLNNGEGVKLRFFGENTEYPPMKHSYDSEDDGFWRDFQPVPLNRKSLLIAQEIALGHQAIRLANSEGSSSFSRDFRRLLRGVGAWAAGMMEYDPRERLHQFVRALEALVPKECRTGKSIALELQLFFEPKEELNSKGQWVPRVELLYEVRSKVEHLADLEEVLPGNTPEQRHQKLLELAMMSELMASSALGRILTTPAIRDVYRTDDSLNRFYKITNYEKSSLLAPLFDVDQEFARRVQEKTARVEHLARIGLIRSCSPT